MRLPSTLECSSVIVSHPETMAILWTCPDLKLPNPIWMQLNWLSVMVRLYFVRINLFILTKVPRFAEGRLKFSELIAAPEMLPLEVYR